MSKISNVITFMQYLSTGKKYSIQELSEKLEVSPRMIRVYKDELEKAASNPITEEMQTEILKVLTKKENN